jgi:hypothetical protein
LRQQYSDRLKIAEACDAAGFLRRSISAHLPPVTDVTIFSPMRNQSGRNWRLVSSLRICEPPHPSHPDVKF